MAAGLNSELCQTLKTGPLSSSDNWFAQMVSIHLPNNISAERVKTLLYDDFQIEVPVISWQNKTLLRVSVQGYNSQDDLQKLIAALQSIYNI